jgi:integrase
MVAFRVVWNHASDRCTLPQNPVRRLRRGWFPKPRRTRIVRAEQMPAFYRAVMALPNKVARDWILLMMFTGMRRTEAASLRWSDIDFVERVIRVPAAVAKSKCSLDLPMSDFVHDLLVARRALGDAKFVFPGNAKCGHIRDTSAPIAQIEKACGIRISAHDLRRGYITIAEGLDISPLALKAMVNHAVGGDVTAGYVVFNTERLRDPVQLIADCIKARSGLLSVAGGKVARLRQRRLSR